MRRECNFKVKNNKVHETAKQFPYLPSHVLEKCWQTNRSSSLSTARSSCQHQFVDKGFGLFPRQSIAYLVHHWCGCWCLSITLLVCNTVVWMVWVQGWVDSCFSGRDGYSVGWVSLMYHSKGKVFLRNEVRLLGKRMNWQKRVATDWSLEMWQGN